MKNKKIALIVLDGWGYREETKDNAIAVSNKPYFEYLWNKYPHTTLEASSLAVGLPEGQIGNSEVGHMTIGAGRVIDSDLVRINKSIEDKSFDENVEFINLFNHVNKYNSTLHIMGLLSDGGVHSHIDQLFSFLKLAKKNYVNDILIHIFTDGRDVPPQSAMKYIKNLEDFITDLGLGKIASLSGRLYSMDRDNNFDRTNMVADIILDNNGFEVNEIPSLYVSSLYKQNIFDEHIKPVKFKLENRNNNIKENDGVFFYNYRADRTRQLSKKILNVKKLLNLHFVTLTDYGEEYKTNVAYPIIKIETTLAKEISLNGLSQVHIAETEKFAHATYFLNGGVELPYKNEEHILIPSHKDVLTHDLAPKMRAKEIADEAINQIEKGTDFVFLNFANADMVGHTANVNAIIEGVEEIDRELKRVIEKLNEYDGIALITADHGNAEINIDPVTGQKHTAHTTDPVPLIITNVEGKLSSGTLADITPTILKILNIPKPDFMTGNNLLN